MAAAVILPFPCPVSGLDDSKKLSSGKRSLLADQVKRQARAWSIGLSWPSEIDQINILQATLKAMARAVKGLKIIPDQILVDGNQKIPLEIPQKTIPGGDSLVPSISAASILAKTFRDGLMVSLEKKYPGYGFAGHKGYGTREHLRAIKSLGPSPVHRMTFKGVRVVTREKMLWLTKG